MTDYIAGLAGEQEIYDPVLKVNRKLADIPGEFHVYTWDFAQGRKVIASAGPPFVVQDLAVGQTAATRIQRFELSNGQAIVGAFGLVFAGENEWLPAADVFDSPLQCPETGDSVQIVNAKMERSGAVYNFPVRDYQTYLLNGVVVQDSGTKPPEGPIFETKGSNLYAISQGGVVPNAPE